MILAGDIGGTNSRLAIFNDDLGLVDQHVYLNAGRTSFPDIVREFIGKQKYPIDKACFAVAGPVSDGRVTLTNLSWHLEEETLAAELKIGKVGLINDLMGHAEGIATLSPDKLICLQKGEPSQRGGRAVIAAGTGLVEAGLFYDAVAGVYRAFPTEGGHADFSPRNELEDQLLLFLRKKSPRVFWEMALSGPGLRNLYDFLKSTGKFAKSDELPDKPEYDGKGPKPADISGAGMAGTSVLAVAALEMFVTLYGAEAGNLALKTLATGGVYLGGGIAPRILAKLQSDRFLDAFRAKSTDKLAAMMRKIPVYVINFELCGLYGAANYASRL